MADFDDIDNEQASEQLKKKGQEHEKPVASPYDHGEAEGLHKATKDVKELIDLWNKLNWKEKRDIKFAVGRQRQDDLVLDSEDAMKAAADLALKFRQKLPDLVVAYAVATQPVRDSFIGKMAKSTADIAEQFYTEVVIPTAAPGFKMRIEARDRSIELNRDVVLKTDELTADATATIRRLNDKFVDGLNLVMGAVDRTLVNPAFVSLTGTQPTVTFKGEPSTEGLYNPTNETLAAQDMIDKNPLSIGGKPVDTDKLRVHASGQGRPVPDKVLQELMATDPSFRPSPNYYNSYDKSKEMAKRRVGRDYNTLGLGTDMLKWASDKIEWWIRAHYAYTKLSEDQDFQHWKLPNPFVGGPVLWTTKQMIDIYGDKKAKIDPTKPKSLGSELANIVSGIDTSVVVPKPVAENFNNWVDYMDSPECEKLRFDQTDLFNHLFRMMWAADKLGEEFFAHAASSGKFLPFVIPGAGQVGWWTNHMAQAKLFNTVHSEEAYAAVDKNKEWFNIGASIMFDFTHPVLGAMAGWGSAKEFSALGRFWDDAVRISKGKARPGFDDMVALVDGKLEPRVGGVVPPELIEQMRTLVAQGNKAGMYSLIHNTGLSPVTWASHIRDTVGYWAFEAGDIKVATLRNMTEAIRTMEGSRLRLAEMAIRKDKELTTMVDIIRKRDDGEKLFRQAMYFLSTRKTMGEYTTLVETSRAHALDPLVVNLVEKIRRDARLVRRLNQFKYNDRALTGFKWAQNEIDKGAVTPISLSGNLNNAVGAKYTALMRHANGVVAGSVDDGAGVVYYATTPEKAAEIVKTGKFPGRSKNLLFTFDYDEALRWTGPGDNRTKKQLNEARKGIIAIKLQFRDNIGINFRPKNAPMTSPVTVAVPRQVIETPKPGQNIVIIKPQANPKKRHHLILKSTDMEVRGHIVRRPMTLHDMDQMPELEQFSKAVTSQTNEVQKLNEVLSNEVQFQQLFDFEVKALWAERKSMARKAADLEVGGFTRNEKEISRLDERIKFIDKRIDELTPQLKASNEIVDEARLAFKSAENKLKDAEYTLVKRAVEMGFDPEHWVPGKGAGQIVKGIVKDSKGVTIEVVDKAVDVRVRGSANQHEKMRRAMDNDPKQWNFWAKEWTLSNMRLAEKDEFFTQVYNSEKTFPSYFGAKDDTQFTQEAVKEYWREMTMDDMIDKLSNDYGRLVRQPGKTLKEVTYDNVLDNVRAYITKYDAIPAEKFGGQMRKNRVMNNARRTLKYLEEAGSMNPKEKSAILRSMDVALTSMKQSWLLPRLTFSLVNAIDNTAKVLVSLTVKDLQNMSKAGNHAVYGPRLNPLRGWQGVHNIGANNSFIKVPNPSITRKGGEIVVDITNQSTVSGVAGLPGIRTLAKPLEKVADLSESYFKNLYGKLLYNRKIAELVETQKLTGMSMTRKTMNTVATAFMDDKSAKVLFSGRNLTQSQRFLELWDPFLVTYWTRNMVFWTTEFIRRPRASAFFNRMINMVDTSNKTNAYGNMVVDKEGNYSIPPASVFSLFDARKTFENITEPPSLTSFEDMTNFFSSGLNAVTGGISTHINLLKNIATGNLPDITKDYHDFKSRASARRFLGDARSTALAPLSDWFQLLDDKGRRLDEKIAEDLGYSNVQEMWKREAQTIRYGSWVANGYKGLPMSEEEAMELAVRRRRLQTASRIFFVPFKYDPNQSFEIMNRKRQIYDTAQTLEERQQMWDAHVAPDGRPLFEKMGWPRPEGGSKHYREAQMELHKASEVSLEEFEETMQNNVDKSKGMREIILWNPANFRSMLEKAVDKTLAAGRQVQPILARINEGLDNFHREISQNGPVSAATTEHFIEKTGRPPMGPSPDDDKAVVEYRKSEQKRVKKKDKLVKKIKLDIKIDTPPVKAEPPVEISTVPDSVKRRIEFSPVAASLTGIVNWDEYTIPGTNDLYFPVPVGNGQFRTTHPTVTEKGETRGRHAPGVQATTGPTADDITSRALSEINFSRRKQAFEEWMKNGVNRGTTIEDYMAFFKPESKTYGRFKDHVTGNIVDMRDELKVVEVTFGGVRYKAERLALTYLAEAYHRNVDKHVPVTDVKKFYKKYQSDIDRAERMASLIIHKKEEFLPYQTLKTRDNARKMQVALRQQSYKRPLDLMFQSGLAYDKANGINADVPEHLQVKNVVSAINQMVVAKQASPTFYNDLAEDGLLYRTAGYALRFADEMQNPDNMKFITAGFDSAGNRRYDPLAILALKDSQQLPWLIRMSRQDRGLRNALISVGINPSAEGQIRSAVGNQLDFWGATTTARIAVANPGLIAYSDIDTAEERELFKSGDITTDQVAESQSVAKGQQTTVPGQTEQDLTEFFDTQKAVIKKMSTAIKDESFVDSTITAEQLLKDARGSKDIFYPPPEGGRFRNLGQMQNAISSQTKVWQDRIEEVNNDFRLAMKDSFTPEQVEDMIIASRPKPNYFMGLARQLPYAPVVPTLKLARSVMSTANYYGLVNDDQMRTINQGMRELDNSNMVLQGTQTIANLFGVGTMFKSRAEKINNRLLTEKLDLGERKGLIKERNSFNAKMAGTQALGQLATFGSGIAANQESKEAAMALGGLGQGLQGFVMATQMGLPPQASIPIAAAFAVAGVFQGGLGARKTKEARKKRERLEQEEAARKAAFIAEQKRRREQAEAISSIRSRSRALSQINRQERAFNQQERQLQFFRRPTFQSDLGIVGQTERRAQRQFRPRF